MKNLDAFQSDLIAEVVRAIIQEGGVIDLDGLGRFVPGSNGHPRFVAETRPRIFIAYVEENRLEAVRLYRSFEDAGYDPWLDSKKLLPGQNWPRAIEEAIDTADFFVPCFSQLSVRKKGTFQAEIRYAMDCARRVPLDDTYLIPTRLDDCSVPRSITREIQYIDLFPDWDRGVKQVLSVLAKQRRKPC